MPDNDPQFCPYVGLTPFTEAQAAYFFGRERERQIIAANLSTSRLTLLYGASGVGKSSVLRAGVIKDLREEAAAQAAEFGEPDFAVVEFSDWHGDPMVGLQNAIAAGVHRSQPRARFDVDPTQRSLIDILTRGCEAIDGSLLCVFDQFEEFFLYHGHEEGPGTFAHEFVRAMSKEKLGAHFLISIREDALATLDAFKGRIPGLFDNYLRLEHLDRASAESAIRLPLDKYNALFAETKPAIGVEDDLVIAVLDQVQTGKTRVGLVGQGVVRIEERSDQRPRVDAPYLQLVMKRVWHEEAKSGSTVLRFDTLAKLGNAAQIVRTHLDQTMGKLSAEQQGIAARFFDRLVTPSGTKIALTAKEMAHFAEVPIKKIEPILEAIYRGDVRILRSIGASFEQKDEPRYEIFHDVLAASMLDWQARCIARLRRRQRVRRGVGVVALAAALAWIAWIPYERLNRAAKQRARASELVVSAVNQIEEGTLAYFAMAEKNLKLAAELDPANTDVSIGLATLYQDRGDATAESGDNKAAALVDFALSEQILLKEPLTPRAIKQIKALQKSLQSMAEQLAVTDEPTAIKLYESGVRLLERLDDEAERHVRMAALAMSEKRVGDSIGRPQLEAAVELPLRPWERRASEPRTGEDSQPTIAPDELASEESRVQERVLAWFERARGHLEPLPQEVSKVHDARAELATAYRDLDPTHGDEKFLEMALAIAPSSSASDADFILGLGKIASELGKGEFAKECFDRGAVIYSGLIDDATEPEEARRQLTNYYRGLATFFESFKDVRTAGKYYHKEVDSNLAWVRSDAESRYAKITLGWSYMAMALNVVQVSGLQAAQPWYEKLHELLETELADGEDAWEGQTLDRIVLYEFLAKNSAKTFKEREPYLRRILEIRVNAAANPKSVIVAGAYASLGSCAADASHPQQAFGYFQSELSLRRAIAEGTPPDDDPHRRLVTTYEWLADVCRDIGRSADAAEFGRQCVEVALAYSIALNDDDGDTFREALYWSALASYQAGDIGGTSTQLQKYYELMSEDEETLSTMPSAHGSMRWFFHAVGRIDEALEHARNELSLRELIANLGEGAIDFQRDLGDAHENLGSILVASGALEESLAEYQAAYQIAIAENDADAPEARQRLAGLLESLATAELDVGKLGGVREKMDQAIAMRTALASDPDDVSAIKALISAIDSAAWASFALGRVEDARAHYRESLALEEKLAADQPANAWFARQRIATSYENLARIAADCGDAADAWEQCEKSLRLRQAFGEADRSNADAKRSLRVLHNLRGDLLRDEGRSELALKCYEDAHAISLELDSLAHDGTREILSPRERANLAYDMSRYGRLELDRGDFEAALKWFDLGVGILDFLDSKKLLQTQSSRDSQAHLRQLVKLCDFGPTLMTDMESVIPKLNSMPELQREALVVRAAVMARKVELDETQRSIDSLRKLGPASPAVLYDLARAYAACGRAIQKGRKLDDLPAESRQKRDEFIAAGVEALSQALAGGFADVPKMLFDDDLEILRQEPGYAAMIERLIAANPE